MMKASLSIPTCDKCGEPMGKRQQVLVIAEGIIAESDDMLTFHGLCVRYACHVNCWNGIEEGE